MLLLLSSTWHLSHIPQKLIVESTVLHLPNRLWEHFQGIQAERVHLAEDRSIEKVDHWRRLVCVCMGSKVLIEDISLYYNQTVHLHHWFWLQHCWWELLLWFYMEVYACISICVSVCGYHSFTTLRQNRALKVEFLLRMERAFTDIHVWSVCILLICSDIHIACIGCLDDAGLSFLYMELATLLVNIPILCPWVAICMSRSVHWVVFLWVLLK